MFSKEIMRLLIQVITSWQVIAVTAALVIYIYIVSSVARNRYRPRIARKVKVKKTKAAPVAAGPEEVVSSSGSDVNDELGLEET